MDYQMAATIDPLAHHGHILLIEGGNYRRKHNMDYQMAATIDPLAHHGHILLIEGGNYRRKHTLIQQKDQIKVPMV